MGEGRTDEPADEPQTNQRLTVAQAAVSLGITEGAVRSRIKRGTLPTVKEGGSVYVVLDDGTSTANYATYTDEPTVEPSAQSELVESLRDQVAFLRAELERRGEEADRYQRIVAGLAQANANLSVHVRELEASPEPRDAPETASEGEGRGMPQEERPFTEEKEGERRSWWHRLLFGP
jgi:hypothetical protein